MARLGKTTADRAAGAARHRRDRGHATASRSIRRWRHELGHASSPHECRPLTRLFQLRLLAREEVGATLGHAHGRSGPLSGQRSLVQFVIPPTRGGRHGFSVQGRQAILANTWSSVGNAPAARLEYRNLPSTVISKTPPLLLRSCTLTLGIVRKNMSRACFARGS